ncbi:DNRLRE domain-containing protein [Cohnella terricola]|uniref:DNRLRE domain-containing protein n=1 Tax=Cohnella terricola TaxID=1289167 RepID=A0A559JDN0_9BACL|nr:DNRLRE domain-containing protein [Cohnella terricola]TVX97978.1 DNRLRE domain-containing protein [Cohnella terricola]
MNEFIDVSGHIIIRPSNRMSGKLNVLASGKSSVPSLIQVRAPSNIAAKMSVYSDQIIEDIAFPPKFGNQRKARMYILNRSDLNASLSVKPKNRMAGRVEIIDPPKLTLEIPIIKDAFTRSSIPTLNYGSEQSMVVGRHVVNNEIYRSFVQFDVTQLPKNIIIEEAYIRLFNSIKRTSDIQLGVYTLDSPWDEDGITWVNQPAINNLVSISDVGSALEYTKLDITNQLKMWYPKGNSNNYGFMIKALNENGSQYVQFSTRESPIHQPYIEITYRQDVIYSFGRVDLPSSIMVLATGKSDIAGSLTIREFDRNGDLPSRVHILNPDMIESNVSVNRPDLIANLTVVQNQDSEIAGAITIRVKGGYLPQDNLLSRIIVNAPDRPSKVWIKNRSEIHSSVRVTVRMNGRNDLLSNIKITRDELSGRLSVRRGVFGDIPSNLKTIIHSNIPSNLQVSRKDVAGSIEVKYFNDLPANLTVRIHEDIAGNLLVLHRDDLPSSVHVIYANTLPGSLVVISGFLQANIKIPAYATQDKAARVTVRAKMVSDLFSSLIVGGDNIPGGYVYIL